VATPTDIDEQLRVAAFDTVRHLAEARGDLTAHDLSKGFEVRGTRIPLINLRRGIFKPTQMRYLLSIKTVYPRTGARIWYDDQREVHKQIYAGDDAIEYAFMGQNPDAADNLWLKEAMEYRVPIIYFLGIAPGRYQAFLPTYVTGWDPNKLKATIVFGMPGETRLEIPETRDDRRYALRDAKHRLHQASFREAVIAAYRGRCAISGLPETLLLDAAHIMADKDELYGQPVVPNGIPLSKIHHAAFDAHLIGIDPDFRIHVSHRLLGRRDGPLLETLKELDGAELRLPSRTKDQPDRDRLAMRYELYKAAA
jgi:putative restriction endonuclease